MKRQRVDVAIIGAGTAGLNARKEAEARGKEWVLVEAGPYGTTCARVGCMPSKLLIAAADAASEARAADEFGVRVEGVTIDGPAVMRRVRAMRDDFTRGVVEATEKLPEERRIRGHARFVGPTTLRIADEREIEAEAVVIATGSSPFVPPNLEAVRDRVMVNDDVFELTDLPSSLAVFGTGIIALELGQALARLGVQVSFFNPYEELGPFVDPAVQKQARRIFGEELDLHLGVDAKVRAHGEAGVEVRWKENGEQQAVRFERVLAAAGRRPNLESLGLEAAGIELGERGVPRHDEQTMQCGEAPVFIAGDVCGHSPLLHEAADEGRIAGANAARFPCVQATVRRAALAVAFTDPQMATVGSRYTDLDPDEFACGEVTFEDQGRAKVIGKNAGIFRIYGKKESCCLLGAEMLGPGVEHMAHLVAWAIQSGVTVQGALQMPFYHPTLEEGLRTALRDLAQELRVTSACRPEDCALQAGD